MYTDVTGSLTTDLPISPYTFSKPDCGLFKYSIFGAGASIYQNNIVRFLSGIEATLSFNLIITAIGKPPTVLPLPTKIKIVNCSSGNIIKGGDWNTNLVLTDVTAA